MQQQPLQIIQKTEEHFTEEILENESDLKRCSSSTNDSEFEGLIELFEEEVEIEPFEDLPTSLVNQKLALKSDSTLSPALQKKAINWLITYCWTKDFSDETLWNSIGYFYGYANSKPLAKEQLTILRNSQFYSVLTVVNLSLKLTEPKKTLTLSELEHILVTKNDQMNYLEMEQEVTRTFDFELYFHHNLSKILALGQDKQKTDSALFISELLFLQNYEVAINCHLLKEVLDFVEDPSTECPGKATLKKIAKSSKSCQVIKQKYNSRFEVEELWEKMIA